MRVVHVAEETGLPIVYGWTFWLPPTEGHAHAVFLSGYDREQSVNNITCGNGLTVWGNVCDRIRRYHAARVPLQLGWGLPADDTCACRRCERLELLAYATVARHEGRLATYHRILEEIREMG